MTDKAVETAVQALERLAAKLGVTAEHMWQVLVRQAQIEAYVTLVCCAIWLIVLVAAVVELRRNLSALAAWHVTWYEQTVKTLPTYEATRWSTCAVGGYYNCACENGKWQVVTAAWVCASLILIGVLYLGLGVTWAVQAAINPEYYALQEILKVLK